MEAAIPRDGSNIYSAPSGTTAVSGTAVASAPYNAFVSDLTTDLNAARPLSAGGTGATTAAGARTNLGVSATDATITAIAALDFSVAGSMLYSTAADTFSLLTSTVAGRALLTAADASAQRTALGLAIGTNVQAYDADLTTWAGLTPSAYFQTLVDDADASAARTTLGLGTAAVKATGTSGNNVPLLDGANTWSGVQTIAAAGALIVNNTSNGFMVDMKLSGTRTGQIYSDATNFILQNAAGSPVNQLVMNWSTGAAAFTGAITSGGVAVPTISSSDALTNKQIRVPVSGETSGTLTSASANKTIQATGDITINDGVFTAEDRIEIYAGASARSIVQDTGMTLRLDGSATTGTRSLAARGRAAIYFVSNSEAIVSGMGVT